VASNGEGTRERLHRDDATDRYTRAGELEVFRQIQRDAETIDAMPDDRLELAVGPFARLRADAVVEAVGKTRGAINNVWGSQEAFRAVVMESFLNDSKLGADDVSYPDPADSIDVDAWLDQLASTEIDRGPRHGMDPDNRYGLRWAAWLGLVPYGIWSERIAGPSLNEYRHNVERYATDVLEPALSRFCLEPTDRTTIVHLASAMVSMIEGTWLNSCLTQADPGNDTGAINETLARSLGLLVSGATRPTNVRQNARH